MSNFEIAEERINKTTVARDIYEYDESVKQVQLKLNNFET